MVLLALGSVFAGGLLVLGGSLQNWLNPVVAPGGSVEVGVHTINSSVLTILTFLVVAGGVLGAYAAVGRRAVPVTAPTAVTPVTTAARRALYADAFNETFLMRPGQWATRAFVFLDGRGIDGAVNGTAALVGGGSGRLRRTQTGYVRSYALSFVGGTVLVLVALLVVRLG